MEDLKENITIKIPVLLATPIDGELSVGFEGRSGANRMKSALVPFGMSQLSAGFYGAYSSAVDQGAGTIR
jgi:hypothetical protein